mmetsp:Transcript_41724/g.129863  ORF Transcript_41724/g.129863 Transcript_41724/m.129863 type:complete len:207 (-) Transcript_41724:897-1517(-)
MLKVPALSGWAKTTSPSPPPRGVMRHSSESRNPTEVQASVSALAVSDMYNVDFALSKQDSTRTPEATSCTRPEELPMPDEAGGDQMGLAVKTMLFQAVLSTSKLLGTCATCPVGGPALPEPPDCGQEPPLCTYASSSRNSWASDSFKMRCPCQCCRKSSPKPSPGMFRIRGQWIPSGPGRRCIDIVKYWLAKSFLRHCFTNVGFFM